MRFQEHGARGIILDPSIHFTDIAASYSVFLPTSWRKASPVLLALFYKQLLSHLWWPHAVPSPNAFSIQLGIHLGGLEIFGLV